MAQLRNDGLGRDSTSSRGHGGSQGCADCGMLGLRWRCERPTDFRIHALEEPAKRPESARWPAAWCISAAAALGHKQDSSATIAHCLSLQCATSDLLRCRQYARSAAGATPALPPPPLPPLGRARQARRQRTPPHPPRHSPQRRRCCRRRRRHHARRRESACSTGCWGRG